MRELSINVKNVRMGTHSANTEKEKQHVPNVEAEGYASMVRGELIAVCVGVVKYANMVSTNLFVSYAKVERYANTIKSGQLANSAEEVQYASTVSLRFIVPIATVDMLANQDMSHTTLVAEHTATNA